MEKAKELKLDVPAFLKRLGFSGVVTSQQEEDVRRLVRNLREEWANRPANGETFIAFSEELLTGLRQFKWLLLLDRPV